MAVVVVVVVVVAALVAVAAVAWGWARPADGRRRRDGGQPVPAGLDPLDVAELDARLASVVHEQHGSRDARLHPALDLLIERQVPGRAVEVASGVGSARVRFADGTALLVQGQAHGMAGVLAAWVHQGSVVLAVYEAGRSGVQLTFRDRAHRRELTLLATGLDQPD